MSNVLIIDDDNNVCRLLESIIRHHGHSAASVQTLKEGLAVVAREAIDLVLLDVHLPDGNGLDHIPLISGAPCRPEIIILTGRADPDGAELAIHSGAWDYIEKSSSPKNMGLKFLRVLEYRAVKKGPAPAETIDRHGIIGSSQLLSHVLTQLAQTVHSDAGVLITGETGTGKELLAHAVHRNSARRSGNFVVVDCAALPKTLVESMLFGYVKGAFTGAEASREGLIAQADGGTLFLDEVGEMHLSLQKAFLRVLESRRFRPIGGKQEVASNFRIVSSTNRDLDEMARQGTFRNDLLYRLRTFHLKAPPLRERRQDIQEIARYHIQRLSNLYGLPAKTLSADIFEILETYDWPGNVRELVNTVDRTLSAANREIELFACHLPAEIRAQVARKNLRPNLSGNVPAPVAALPPALPPLHRFRDEAVEKAEVNYLHHLMAAAEGNMTRACSMAGVSRSRLYELLKKHAIPA
jgi:two-component system, NtrC family, response regulator